ncbi:hypothetical protein A1D18_02305 [Candidatus Rickettsiella isopodorum]|jgi:hypothetical protein|uniref:Glycerophosphoryl diester phosphodiesterase membrane domain-containing protein n=1 Tax=Candidatus Rickettsiella isopodorum TaxID=1225476 RepID=A0A1J8PIL6_9COXI|nr:hypothetical protein [Candidatus Rickettsiella isopodorum]OIZ94957.1 hypothetical protein A1D18_02305 [Candidatus Rickettsiella isopodorum]
MSNSIPPNFFKAASGDYRIPIKAIFLEAWYRVKGMKVSYWGGFLYFILVMALACLVLGLVLALYDVFVLPLATAHNAIALYDLKLGLKFIVVGIVEILRFLLTASLAFMALQHLRNEPIHASMVFSFRHAWRPLLIIALLLYLFNSFIISSTNILLHSVLFKQQMVYLGSIVGSIFLFVVFIIGFFLYFYFSILVFMTVLLILDQKMTGKQSLRLAFQSINQHFFKNITLIIVTSIVFGLLALMSLGIGLIWLLPMTSLVTAIQYNQIFCEGSL